MDLHELMFIAIIFRNSNAVIMEEKPPGLFPDDYDKYEPPWQKGMPAHVYLQLNIMDVDKIDDGALEFSVQSYFNEYWKDMRLNLSSYTMASSIEPILSPFLRNLIWLPDLVFDNTNKGELFHLSIPNLSIKVVNNNTFFRSTRYNLIVGCMMNFRLYPMDTQHCFLKVATMANPDFKVLLHWAEEFPAKKLQSINLVYNIQPLKYVLRKPLPYKCTEVWASGNYTFLYANFTFVRRLSASVFNTYVPSTLVVFLSWISFWLDVKAVPARITLGVTSLLTLATQVVQARSGLPPISYMTAMDVWQLACIFTVFCSLLEFAFAYQLLVKRKQKQINLTNELHDVQAVNHLDTVINVGTGKNQSSRFNRDSSLRRTCSNHNAFMVSETSSIRGKTARGRSLDKVCRKLFPFSFCLFSVVYWVYYLSLKK